MNVKFTNEDRFIGFMKALQIVGVGWEQYDEDLGTQVMPIEDKEIRTRYKNGITINFGEYGITYTIKEADQR